MSKYSYDNSRIKLSKSNHLWVSLWRHFILGGFHLSKRVQSYRYAWLVAIVLHILFILFIFGLSYWQPRRVRPTLVMSQYQPVAAQVISGQQLKKISDEIAQEKRKKAREEERKRDRMLAEIKAAKARRLKLARASAIAKQKQVALARERQALLAAKHKKQLALAAAKKKRQLQANAKKKQLAAKLAQKKAQQLAKTLLDKQIANEQKEVNQVVSSQLQPIINRYKAQILSKISQYWLVPKQLAQGISATLMVHLAPGGVVISVKLIKSSGNAALDRSAQTAVMQSSPLPVPVDTRLFDNFRVLRLTVRPQVS